MATTKKPAILLRGSDLYGQIVTNQGIWPRHDVECGTHDVRLSSEPCVGRRGAGGVTHGERPEIPCCGGACGPPHGILSDPCRACCPSGRNRGTGHLAT